MVVGQFGAYINEMMADWDRGDLPGRRDPQRRSVQVLGVDLAHNDWLVLVPIFYEDELVGWSSQFGHQMDAGGPLPGSLPTGATHDLRGGHHHPAAQDHRARRAAGGRARPDPQQHRASPEMNRADLFAIVAGCRAGEKRVIELCDRFGKRHLPGGAAGAARPHLRGDAHADPAAIPEEPQTFEDYVDDDGLGNGPFKMKLTIWREGDHAFFDWTGTDPAGARARSTSTSPRACSRCSSGST